MGPDVRLSPAMRNNILSLSPVKIKCKFRWTNRRNPHLQSTIKSLSLRYNSIGVYPSVGVIVSWLVQQLHSWRLHRMRVTMLAACCLLLLLAATRAPATRPPRPRARGGGAVWTWVCDPRPGQRLCLKLRSNSSLPAQSEARCRASCSPEYNLWPLPRQAGLQVTIKSNQTKIHTIHTNCQWQCND